MKMALSRILAAILTFAMIVSVVAVMPVTGLAAENTVSAEAADGAVAQISLDFSDKDQEIADTMYGIFFEDINWAGDGGLYPEKFTNRSFEYFGNDWNSMGSLTGHNRTTDAQAHRHGWLPVGDASFEVVQGDNATAMNQNNTYFANLSVNEANAGILNYGYGNITGRFNNGNEVCYPGMNFKAGDVYYFSMYVYGAVDTEVTVALYGAGGNSNTGMFAEGTYEVGKATFPVKTTGEGWQKVKAEVTVERDVAVDGAYKADGFAAITFADAGEYTLDFISLFPQATYNNRENGLRADLVQMLKDMQPGFVRFPGGCIIEGVGPTNRYNWKKTVGSIEERKLDWNLWNEHLYAGGSSNTYYYQSFGLGFYEYMLLCEDIGAEPMPVFNCGMACELRSGSLFSGADRYAAGTDPATFDVANLQPFIDDAIDFMDFCLADPAENEWAALRAEMGHPEPFELNFVSIGNEQSNAIFAVYYDAFITQMRAEYPDIKYIPSWNQGNTMYNWLINGNTNSPGPKTLDYAWAADEHYYVNSESQMYNNYVKRYDSYPRVNANGETRTYVFAGEYALRSNSTNYTFAAALAEAAVMTGLERNSDLVKMASYAPLFYKDGFAQWDPSLIAFTEYTTYGSSSYYTQKLFGQNPGDFYIKNSVGNLEAEGEDKGPDGAFGVGSYKTQVYYKNIKAYDTTTNEVILDDPDGSILLANSAQPGGQGTWRVQEYEEGKSALYQDSTSVENGALVYTPSYDMSNYTVEIEAMKVGGAEGFLLPFLYNSTSDYHWFNLGAWSNARVCLEKGTGLTNRTQPGRYIYASDPQFGKYATLDSNRWYKLKVVLNGDKASAYAAAWDDELGDYTAYDLIYSDLVLSNNVAPSGASAMYTSTTYDAEANEIIIKTVSNNANPEKVKFVLNNVDSVNSVGEMIQMKGNNGKTGNGNKNSLAAPENISDKHYTFEGFDTEFYYTLPAYSFTIFRISLDDDANKIVSAENAVVNTTEGVVPELPAQVDVTYADGGIGIANVTWDAKPDCFYGIAGQYQIEGDIEGTNLKGYIDVTVAEKNEYGIISVNGGDPAAQHDVEANEIATVVLATATDIDRLGLFNENGKGITKQASYSDEGDVRTWTVDFSIATKGERAINIRPYVDGAFAESDMNVLLKVGPKAVNPALSAEVISAAAGVEQIKKNEGFTVTVVTGAGAKNIGLFNENGAALGKSNVTKTVVGETIEWTATISIGSKGTRTIAVKALDAQGNWTEAAQSFSVVVVK